MRNNGECSDHVIVGTRAGDCLFLDTAHDGQVMLCFPAHRCDDLTALFACMPVQPNSSSL